MPPGPWRRRGHPLPTYYVRVTGVLEASAAADSRKMPPPPEPKAPATTIERLRVPMPTDRLAGWLVAVVITAIAFAIRIVNLSYPNKLVFDETYYAKTPTPCSGSATNAAGLNRPMRPITAGNVDVMEDSPSFIVHPQVGKWLIAAGEQIFGMNSFGWRFASWSSAR